MALGSTILQNTRLGLAGLRPGQDRIEQESKASREVRVGDRLKVRNEAGECELEVLLLSEMRGPAAVAQTLYRETESSKELRLKAIEERKAMPDWTREGKPSKKDRRDMARVRGRN